MRPVVWLMVWAAAAATTTKLTQDQLAALAVTAQLNRCTSAGITCNRGVYLYGDYKSVAGVKDAVTCAAACEADTKCMHWNFHASIGTGCDLNLLDVAYFNEDAKDWVSGDSVRVLLTTTTATPDQAVLAELARCAAAGISCKRGVYLYGDYMTVDVSDAVSCEAACEADPLCTHWQLHAAHAGACDLKSSPVGFNEDAIMWVCGAISRTIVP